MTVGLWQRNVTELDPDGRDQCEGLVQELCKEKMLIARVVTSRPHYFL